MSSSPPDDSSFPTSSLPAWQVTMPDGFGAPRTVPTLRNGRAPQRRSLTDEAHVWIARIPPRFQPLATARRHPHIVNRLAELWATPDALAPYFSELMLSRRPGRQGFTFDVLTELFDLQALLQSPTRH